jgi:hypothetical protein
MDISVLSNKNWGKEIVVIVSEGCKAMIGPIQLLSYVDFRKPAGPVSESLVPDHSSQQDGGRDRPVVGES